MFTRWLNCSSSEFPSPTWSCCDNFPQNNISPLLLPIMYTCEWRGNSCPSTPYRRFYAPINKSRRTKAAGTEGSCLARLFSGIRKNCCLATRGGTIARSKSDRKRARVAKDLVSGWFDDKSHRALHGPETATLMNSRRRERVSSSRDWESHSIIHHRSIRDPSAILSKAYKNIKHKKRLYFI